MGKLLLHRNKIDSLGASRLLGGLLLALFLLLGGEAPLSAQPAPFENGKWKSVDQFVDTPQEQDVEEVEEEAPPEPKVAPKAEAKPNRAALPKIETPTMEAGQGQIMIDSTADTQEQGLVKKAVQTQKPGSAAASATSETSGDHAASDKPKAPVNPFNVRLAGLPSVYVKPAPPAPVVRPKKKIAKPKENQPKPTKEACEALTSMQKRELDAIEKDKETLSALRAAIKDLGLSNKLNYSPEKGSVLGSAQPAAQPAAQPTEPQKTTKR